jgi:two-component system, NarL family, nitrate/nitrite response regulator NarL
MEINPADCVAVFSLSPYRADSIASVLVRDFGFKAVAVTQPHAATLARFELVLLDVDANLESALQLNAAITLQSSGSKVVWLGIIESDENVIKLAEVGASGYIPQQSSFIDLVTVVRAVQKGEFACASGITYALFSHLARLARQQRFMEGQPAILTARQRLVMNLVSQNLSNRQILKKLGIAHGNLRGSRRATALRALTRSIPS